MTKSERAELKLMIEAVDRFSDDMKRKLRLKAAQGYSGGLSSSNRRRVAKKLNEHVDRLIGVCECCGRDRKEEKVSDRARQAVDVANLAMMLWVMAGSPRS